MVGDVVASAMSHVWLDAASCTLEQFASIDEDLSATGMTKSSSMQDSVHRPSVLRQTKAFDRERDKIFHLEPPLACIRRGEAMMDVATSALAFWEELSFAPLSGSKDVAAVAVCPASAFLQERTARFLSAIGSTYQSLKFGTHKACHLLESGIVPVITTPNDLDKSMNDLCEASDKIGKSFVQQPIGDLLMLVLGRTLAKSTLSNGNFVVYMVDAFGELRSLPRLCEAFLRMFDAYAQSLKETKRQDHYDLILQIIPLSIIASEHSLTLPNPTTLGKLASEVYDRCAPSCKPDSAEMTPFTYAPAVRLARMVPRSINLQLTAKPPGASPLSDRCIHVSYSHPQHSSWLTASWVDDWGSLQWNTCYHLTSDMGDIWPEFKQAAEDIWETTLEAARFHSTPYRILIVKCGSMPDTERKGT